VALYDFPCLQGRFIGRLWRNFSSRFGSRTNCST